MFTRQAPLIAQSLWQGGLSPAQAHAVTNALGQCRAPIVHRGPIQVDYSSPDMRLITPQGAQFRFPDIQLQPPEFLPPRPRPPEEQPEEEPPQKPNPLPPPQNPVTPVDPGGGWLPPEYRPPDSPQRPGTPGSADCCVPYTGGDYIDVDEPNKKINLRTEQNSTGRLCTFGVGEIIGKDLVEENLVFDGGDGVGCASLSVDKGADKITLRLEAATMVATSYVKDIWFDVATQKFNVQYETAYVFDPSDAGTDTNNIPVVNCPDNGGGP